MKLDGIPVLHCISSFEGTSYKKLHDTTSPFVSCCFTLAFFICISRYDFLQVFRTSFTIFGKIFLSQILLFMDSPKPLQPLNNQSPLIVTKVFC